MESKGDVSILYSHLIFITDTLNAKKVKNISRFFTLYWIVYFPTCIAYNDLPGFSSVDEGVDYFLYRVFLVFWCECQWRCLARLDAGDSTLFYYLLYVDIESTIYKEAKEVDVDNHGCHFILMDYVSSTSLRFTSGG